MSGRDEFALYKPGLWQDKGLLLVPASNEQKPSQKRPATQKSNWIMVVAVTAFALSATVALAEPAPSFIATSIKANHEVTNAAPSAAEAAVQKTGSKRY